MCLFNYHFWLLLTQSRNRHKAINLLKVTYQFPSHRNILFLPQVTFNFAWNAQHIPQYNFPVIEFIKFIFYFLNVLSVLWVLWFLELLCFEHAKSGKFASTQNVMHRVTACLPATLPVRLLKN